MFKEIDWEKNLSAVFVIWSRWPIPYLNHTIFYNLNKQHPYTCCIPLAWHKQYVTTQARAWHTNKKDSLNQVEKRHTSGLFIFIFKMTATNIAYVCRTCSQSPHHHHHHQHDHYYLCRICLLRRMYFCKLRTVRQLYEHKRIYALGNFAWGAHKYKNMRHKNANLSL